MKSIRYIFCLSILLFVFSACDEEESEICIIDNSYWNGINFYCYEDMSESNCISKNEEVFAIDSLLTSYTYLTNNNCDDYCDSLDSNYICTKK